MPLQTDRQILQQIQALVDMQLSPGPIDPPLPPPIAIRLLQWNAHHSWKGTDNVFNQDRAADWVATMQPYICSFNEMDDPPGVEKFRARLQARLGGTWTSFYDGRGNALMTRLPMVDKKLVTIDATLPAYMVVGRITLPSGRILRVGSTHLHVSSQASRQHSADTLLVEGQGDRLDIVLGDFNMQVGVLEYLTMAQGFLDVWPAAKALGVAVNYPGNCDGCTKNSRIDYAWIRSTLVPASIQKAEIVDTRDPAGVMPSDHRPLLVTLGL